MVSVNWSMTRPGAAPVPLSRSETTHRPRNCSRERSLSVILSPRRTEADGPLARTLIERFAALLAVTIGRNSVASLSGRCDWSPGLVTNTLVSPPLLPVEKLCPTDCSSLSPW
jgi:hypothetical protein